MSVYSFQCQITHYKVGSFCVGHASKNGSYKSLTNQTKLWCISNQCHWAQTNASFRTGWGRMSFRGYVYMPVKSLSELVWYEIHRESEFLYMQVTW